jgi:uncharacterized protein (TIGR02246 family)
MSMTQRTRMLAAGMLVGLTGCVFVAGNTGSLSGITTRSERTEASNEITEMMQESARAWTRGDLEGFMASYEDSPATTYVTPKLVVHGRDAIRDRYAPRFVPGARHDALTFENVEVDLLAPDIANVIGYYRLIRGDSTTAYGPTSLVMRRRDGKWRIIHDHSS